MAKLFNYLSLLCIITIGAIAAYMCVEYYRGALVRHPNAVEAVDINSQNIIVAASDDKLFFWDNQRCTDQLSAHKGGVSSCAFSHSDTLVVSCSASDGQVKVWRLSTKKAIATLNTFRPIKLMFDRSDNYIICICADNKIQVWDWKKNEVIKEENEVYLGIAGNLSISKGNVLAYTDTNCRVNILNIGTLKTTNITTGYCGITQISSDGNTIAVKPKNEDIHIIDASNGKYISDVPNNDKYVFEPFKFSPDGKWLLNGWGGLISIFDWRQNKPVQLLEYSPMYGTVNDFVFPSGGQLVSANSDSAIKLWNMHTGKIIFSVGAGELANKIISVFFLIVVLTLVFGFCGILVDSDSKFSSFVIIAILSVWTFGILIPFYYLRSSFTKYTITISWCTTAITLFLLLTIYGAFWALYILPFGLFCGYQQIKYGDEKYRVIISVILNLGFCLFLCYLKYFKNILIF